MIRQSAVINSFFNDLLYGNCIAIAEEDHSFIVIQQRKSSCIAKSELLIFLIAIPELCNSFLVMPEKCFIYNYK